MNKLLLITYYWQPWNNPGVFRWLWFSKYIHLSTVLTCGKPVKSFYDETLPVGYADEVQYFRRTLGTLWGILLIPKALKLSRDVEKVIITSPPESLIITAWVLQLFGREVYLDMRDAINRKRQPCRFVIPIYRFFYKRIKNVCVVMGFIDKMKLTIHHGYEPVLRADDFLKDIKIGGYGGFNRIKYYFFMDCLGHGMRIDYQYCSGYGSRTAITAMKYGLAVNLDKLHPEYQTISPQSWEIQAGKMQRFINDLR